MSQSTCLECQWGWMDLWNSRQTCCTNSVGRAAEAGAWAEWFKNVAWLFWGFFKSHAVYCEDTEQILALCSFNKHIVVIQVWFTFLPYTHFCPLKLIFITCCDSVFSFSFSLAGRLFAADCVWQEQACVKVSITFELCVCEMRSRWLPRLPKADSLPQHHGLDSHTP